MIQFPRCATVIALVLGAVFIGCAKQASDEIDFGTFHNSVYTNQYFGVSFIAPSGWSIQDQAAQQRLTKMGSAALSGDDKNMKAILKAAAQQTVQLFSVFQHPLGSPVPSNPAFMGVAEKVSQLPGIQKGRDYHYQLKKLMEQGQMQVSFPKETYTERVAGEEFDVLDQEISLYGRTIKQRYYTTIKKGYALSFVLTFISPEEEAVLQKVLATVILPRP